MIQCCTVRPVGEAVRGSTYQTARRDIFWHRMDVKVVTVTSKAQTCKAKCIAK